VTERGLDEDGTIVREGALDRVPAAFVPVVDAARARITATFGGPRLHSAYLYGSIPRGTAVPGVSDLDLLIVFRDEPAAADRAAANALEAALDDAYTQITGVGIVLGSVRSTLSELERYDGGFFVACLCTPLLGEDLAAQLHRRPGALARRRVHRRPRREGPAPFIGYLGRRGGEDWRGALDDQDGSGGGVRDQRDRTGVLFRPLAGIVLWWRAARPGKTKRYADPGAYDDQADRPGDAASAGLAVARDHQAGQALAGQHVVQLALQRDPQAELVISMDGHGDLSFLRRTVAAAADRALCSPRT
jgi:predicted nucleotidyltransferase